MSDTEIAVGAVDTELTELGGGRFEIICGARRFVVEATGEQWTALRDVITAIVPKLRRSAPIGDQLDADELRAVRPYLKQLAAFGVVLFPRVDIDTPAQRRLYSFLARRSDEADRIYASIQRKTIEITGPAAVAEPIRDALSAQGLSVADNAADPALTVVVSTADRDALMAANERNCRDGRSWVPILVTSRRVVLGPWTIPGESACLRCGPGQDLVPESTASGSWLTMQPGLLGWIAGLVAHNTLRAFVPMAADHPWGEVVTVDPATGQQFSHRAWRDPYCVDCAVRAPAAAEWVEV